MAAGQAWRRAASRVRHARLRQANRPINRATRLASMLVVVSAGLMMATSANTSGGTDLRPTRNDDLTALVRAQAGRNAELTERVGTLREQVDLASVPGSGDQQVTARLDEASQLAGLTPVKGPAVSVELTDAPLSVKPAGVDEDLLVVHQQDIQTVVNALWAGGAEAMTIQEQRVTSLTGIKCVGNTVVLRGVPYAPPYVVTAIGDQDRLEKALAATPAIGVYQQYVEAYGLGWKQQRLREVTMPGYSGALELHSASTGG
ncbi:DUF881 domain-containing protein [Luteococcus sp.]|uniref:DUF881 domain-containing protein n=1 Tax=Luteococcus sp. TaxID=1969402 RepID=UPI0037363080